MHEKEIHIHMQSVDFVTYILI